MKHRSAKKGADIYEEAETGGTPRGKTASDASDARSGEKAEGRRDRGGRNGGRAASQHHISRGASERTPSPRLHFRKDAEAFHPDPSRRPGDRRPIPLRSR